MPGGKRDGKSGPGRTGGGGGGGRRPMSRDVTVSKKLSWLLRHGAGQVGLKVHSGGWVALSDVLAWQDARRLNVTFAEVKEIVTTNEKKRFQVAPIGIIEDVEEPADTDQPAVLDLLTLDEEQPDEPARHVIRATQGHSMKGVEAGDLLTRIALGDIPDKYPELVVHGTDSAAWEKIKTSGGLKPMGRQHVHFAAKVAGGEDKVVSGMRSSATILIWASLAKSIADGVEWWVSANNVILTSGVDGLLPLKYVDRVERRQKGSVDVEVIWSSQEAPEEQSESAV